MPTDYSKNPPPYMSFGVFASTNEQLKESTVPTGPLDRRVLHGLSGNDYGALMSGLKFLGLIDEERKAMPAYHSLIRAHGDAPEYKRELWEIIAEKYKPVIGNVKLESGTASELEKAFKEYGVPAGQMLTKTIRFFIKAATECGQVLSTHITKPRPKMPRTPSTKNGGDRSRTRTKLTPLDNFPGGSGNQILPEGVERMPIPGLPDAFIQYPADLTEAHCDLFTAMIGVLKTYATGRAGGKGKTP